MPPFNYTVGILGATGTIGSLIVRNLLEQGVPREQLLLANQSGKSFEDDGLSLPVVSLDTLFQKSDLIALCVKPQIFTTMELPFRDGQMVMSPMSGLSIETITQKALQQDADVGRAPVCFEGKFSAARGTSASHCQKNKLGHGPHIRVARFMPNTACRIGLGLAGAFQGNLTEAEFAAAKFLFGDNLIIELASEELLDIITAAASGIAFFFYLVELLEEKNLAILMSVKHSNTLIAALEHNRMAPADPYARLLFQNALAQVYVRTLELAGRSTNDIAKTPIAQQQNRVRSALNTWQFDSAAQTATLQERSEKLMASFAEAMIIFFEQNNFEKNIARQIAIQTLKGAVGLLTQNPAPSASALRAAVTSKGGTTQAGLRRLGLRFDEDAAEISYPTLSALLAFG